MPRVKFNIAAITRELRNAVDDAARNNSFFKQAGELVTTRIKLRARQGKPLNESGTFPPLSQSTIEARKKYAGKAQADFRASFDLPIGNKKAKKEATHPAFRPSKSNLTLTGQLLDAVSFRRKRARKFEVFIAPSKRSDIDTNNQKIAGYLADIGFVIFDKKGIDNDKKIPRRLKQLLLRFLRKQLKRK